MKHHFKGFMSTSFPQLLLSPREREPSATALSAPRQVIPAGLSLQRAASPGLHPGELQEDKEAPTMQSRSRPKRELLGLYRLITELPWHTYISSVLKKRSAALMLKFDSYFFKSSYYTHWKNAIWCDMFILFLVHLHQSNHRLHIKRTFLGLTFPLCTGFSSDCPQILSLYLPMFGKWQISFLLSGQFLIFLKETCGRNQSFLYFCTEHYEGLS